MAVLLKDRDHSSKELGQLDSREKIPEEENVEGRRAPEIHIGNSLILLNIKVYTYVGQNSKMMHKEFKGAVAV